MPSVHGHGGHSPFLMLWLYRSWISCITVAPSLKLNIYDCAPSFHVLPGVLFLITSGKTECFRELVRNADKLSASLRNKNWCNWLSRSAGVTVLGKGSQNEIFDGQMFKKLWKWKVCTTFCGLLFRETPKVWPYYDIYHFFLHRHNLSFWLSLLRTSLPRSRRRQVRKKRSARSPCLTIWTVQPDKEKCMLWQCARKRKPLPEHTY